jgi:hypothetical protein
MVENVDYTGPLISYIIDNSRKEYQLGVRRG